MSHAKQFQPTPRPTPRTVRDAFPAATRASLYSHIQQDPERRLVGPAMVLICAALAGLILMGVIQL